ncbi:glutaredoxin family protein [Candidatus Parcubacteria bacterium]|nr:glutaredoxin family protein [Candidatus Parcubacteria bacterium]
MNIIVYTKTGCPWCKGVLDLLNGRKIPYEERNVLIDPVYMDELIKKSAQTKTPTLDIDGAIIADSDKEQVEAYLKEKGVIPKE